MHTHKHPGFNDPRPTLIGWTHAILRFSLNIHWLTHRPYFKTVHALWHGTRKEAHTFTRLTPKIVYNVQRRRGRLLHSCARAETSTSSPCACIMVIFSNGGRALPLTHVCVCGRGKQKLYRRVCSHHHHPQQHRNNNVVSSSP